MKILLRGTGTIGRPLIAALLAKGHAVVALTRSPENYVGYARTEHFTSPGWIRLNVPHAYKAPNRLALDHCALWGDWTIQSKAIALNKANGSIAYRFNARDLHLVMGAATPERPYDSACTWTDSPRALLTALSWMNRETAR